MSKRTKEDNLMKASAISMVLEAGTYCSSGDCTNIANEIGTYFDRAAASVA